MKTKKIRNSIILIITALIWGTAFVAQSEGGKAVGPYTFNCIRSIIGGIVLIPVIFILDKAKLTHKRPETKEEKKILIKAGIICGILLALASSMQQIGIYYGATVGKAGFLTACYILIVPILGLFLKKKCGINVWIGVGITLIGLYLLCINNSFSFKLCDALILICALLFSVHILVIDHFSPMVDGVRMSCIQFFTCGIVCAIPMFMIDMKHSLDGMFEVFLMLDSQSAIVPILYAGILSCGVAYTLQIVGQNGLNPTIASLLLSLESVFSVLAGWIVLGQKMSKRELIGCGLIFIAIIFAQLDFSKKSKNNKI